MSARPGRRTQAERREATVARLLRATVACLAERGYARTSTQAIVQRAGLSQGALFRHFPTRLDLLAAAAEAIGRGHVEAIDGLRAQAGRDLDAATAIDFIRDAARSDAQAAWHEVMVAARTDPELRARVRPVLQRYEAALTDLAAALLRDDHPDPEAGRVRILSLLHLFDSEAVTRRVHSSPRVEEARRCWAIDLLRAEMTARA